MKMLKAKKGFIAMKSGIITAAVAGLIVMTILLQVFSNVLPTVNTAAQAVNDTGAPLTGLFNPTSGVVVLMLVAALILVIVGALLGKGRK